MPGPGLWSPDLPVHADGRLAPPARPPARPPALQDISGLWDRKPVQCSSGAFLPGDYGGWRRWRDSLSDVEKL